MPSQTLNIIRIGADNAMREDLTKALEVWRWQSLGWSLSRAVVPIPHGSDKDTRYAAWGHQGLESARRLVVEADADRFYITYACLTPQGDMFPVMRTIRARYKDELNTGVMRVNFWTVRDDDYKLRFHNDRGFGTDGDVNPLGSVLYELLTSSMLTER